MCELFTDSASILKTEIVALSLFKTNWTGFLSHKLSCQQKEELFCVRVKVCHSKLNSCSVAGLGVKVGFPFDPKEEQYFSELPGSLTTLINLMYTASCLAVVMMLK